MTNSRRCAMQKKNNSLIVITLIVLIEFQVSAVCDLHGFSPQRGIFPSGENGENRGKRGVELFRNLYASGNKAYESVKQFSKNGEILTREIQVRQGKLRGVVREFRNPRLKNVDTFLGIPYAAPPVKALRFMPPGSPRSWKDTKVFNTFGPVCPQRPPDLTRKPLKTMNVGQYNRLKGLMPFLTNQSEDCLYLNIYAPQQDLKYQTKYPVIVYIHGESFEWNSGNPYDGSVLASYGNVVVVTINFRLGILGFLKPGLSEHTVSNFGLLDQIAALQWIKENIEEFGGDSSMVTLMGQGTGAACINFLMVSPVSMASEGLFHKAILMSGTALSDWAVTSNPLQFTIQVAEALNCPLIEKNDELPNCLRRKRLSEIMSVKINVPEFQTPFGPIIDGSVVPNTPQQLMGVYQNLFTRYDLLYGITEWETYHSLDPVSLTYGMLEEERNEILKKYMHYRFETLPYFALATTLSEYLNRSKPNSPAKSAAEEHRDLVLDVLSDARFVAPVIQMAQYHSKVNPKSYFYLFRHKSNMGEFAEGERSISGEEISYAFGCPLLNEVNSLAYHKFNSLEQLLSEYMLTYFTNFAKTGNPNAPRRVEYMTLSPKEWQNFDVYWPEYDPVNQTYMALDIPPFLGNRYRSQMTQFWNQILPESIRNPTKTKLQRPVTLQYDEITESIFPKRIPINTSLNSLAKKTDKNKNSWTYGTVRVSPDDYQRDRKTFRASEPDSESSFTKLMDYPLEESGSDEDNYQAHSTWIPYLISISIGLLIINVIIIAIYYFKKKSRTLGGTAFRRPTPRILNDEGFEKGYAKGRRSFYASGEDSESSTPLRISLTESEKKPGMLKKVLSNTSEGSSKVREWFQSEILAKCTKEKKDVEHHNSLPLKVLPKEKLNAQSRASTGKVSQPVNSILKNTKRVCKSNEDLNVTPKRQTVEKKSVGIDATPSSRGESVLKQIPIELTKSLDQGILNTQQSDLLDQTGEERAKPARRSRTSISLQILPTNDQEIKFITPTEPEIIRLVPKSGAAINNLVTFSPKNTKDINVTSRDSDIVSEGTHADLLENIQKRNFPKVLPDFPDFKVMKRLSFPQTTLLNIVESNRNKLHSQSSPQQHQQQQQQQPPPPPPRVSTLHRKDKQTSENQASAPKFLAFSTVNLKTPEKKTEDHPVGMNKGKIENEKDENSASSTQPSVKSDTNAENSESARIENKKKRELPSIVIQPKIGPKKLENQRNKSQGKKPRINLQAPNPEKSQNSKNAHLDTKGPSEKSRKSRQETATARETH